MKQLIGLVIFSGILILQSTVFAEALTYPELQVSPRASERLLMEAKIEKSNRWSTHLPVQISGLATLLAGLYSSANRPDEEKVKPDDASWAKTTAIGVGAAWLVGTYFLAEQYTPYSKGVSYIQNLPNKTNQEILTRERIAEEHIESAGQIGDRIMWLSVISNSIACTYVAGNASRSASIVAGIAGLVAFTPLVFRYSWQNVSKYHQEYKKKIYGPIALPTLMTTNSTVAKNSLVPGVSWLFSF